MFRLRSFPLWALILLTFPILAEDSENTQEDTLTWQLMLAGGSLNTCSSMSPGNCTDTNWIDESMRQGVQVELSKTNIERILASSIWTASTSNGRTEIRRDVERMLNQLQGRFGDQAIALSELTRILRNTYPNLWRNLYDREWYLIRDTLQQAESQTRQEQVRLDLSKEPAGAGLFYRFVEQANRLTDNEKPAILVVTASGRDSFDAVDFYVNAFKNAGAEVRWLPIDAGFTHALAAGECGAIDKYRESTQISFDRAAKYPHLADIQQHYCEHPEQLADAINSAQGLFINGGDQTLTRAAFHFPDGSATPWLTALQHRVQEGEMIAGGTSAGTAIMPSAPMISNGSSESALRDGAHAGAPPATDCERAQDCPASLHADSLTYHPEGGIQLFPFGLLDTHFSERGRQARLLKLAAATNTPLAVGVDETTALLVNVQTGEFEVAGAHGVFFIEQPIQGEQSVASYFHYLRHGSRGTLTAQGLVAVDFAAQAAGDQGSSGEGVFLRDRTITAALQQCRRNPLLTLTRDGISVLLRASEDTQLAHVGNGCEVVNGGMAFSWD
ncbi:MAG: cyanophycinase [Idiomarina sp.]|nr:cyanophycinase [Idiomarina sp.]